MAKRKVDVSSQPILAVVKAPDGKGYQLTWLHVKTQTAILATTDVFPRARDAVLYGVTAGIGYARRVK